MHTRVVEQIVDLTVPLISEKFVEIIQLVPLERIKDQIVEHIGGVPVSQIKEDIVQNLVGEQIVDVPVPQIQGRFAARAGACVKLRRGADRGFPSAPDHGEARGCCSACAIGADPRSKYGADSCGVPDHGES